MGDRTYATVTIHKDFKQVVGTDNDKICDEYGLDEVREDEGDDLVMFVDSQANYGHIEELETLLKEKEIEFTLRWEDGSEYKAGCEYWRHIDGNYKCNELYDDQSAVVDALRELLEKNTPETIVQAIHDKIKYYIPFEETPLKGSNVKRFIKEDQHEC